MLVSCVRKARFLFSLCGICTRTINNEREWRQWFLLHSASHNRNNIVIAKKANYNFAAEKPVHVEGVKSYREEPRSFGLCLFYSWESERLQRAKEQKEKTENLELSKKIGRQLQWWNRSMWIDSHERKCTVRTYFLRVPSCELDENSHSGVEQKTHQIKCFSKGCVNRMAWLYMGTLK